MALFKVRFTFYCFNTNYQNLTPEGATALIAIIGSDKIKDLGYIYVFSPVLIGVLILLLVALIVNNMTTNRSYPSHKKYSNLRKKIAHKIKKKKVQILTDEAIY